MEDLKAVSVRLEEPPQVLYRDALTGAQTVYYKLDTTVPTSPALFDEISNYEGVYFYENRQTSAFVAVRATLPHTDPETGMRYQMFSVSRPAGYNLFYIKESELAAKYKIVSKTRARNWWKDEERKIPPVEQKTVHLLSGALLPIWKYLKNLQQQGLNIVRTTTDDGIRLVGVNLSGQAVNEIRRTFGLWENSTTAEEILRSSREENEIVELAGDVKIRQTRFQGRSVLEVCPSSYEQIRELRETGLINIAQNSRQRFFISENEEIARESLEKVIRMYPPVFLLKGEPETIYAQNRQEFEANGEPVFLPEWLIEPETCEIERIVFRN
jgi:hypothetical protein